MFATCVRAVRPSAAVRARRGDLLRFDASRGRGDSVTSGRSPSCFAVRAFASGDAAFPRLKQSPATTAPSSDDPTDGSTAPPRPLTNAQYVKAISDLSKARLSALVVSTAIGGFLASGGPISIPTLTTLSFGTALCSSSASAFNQLFEVDLDRRMKRTAHRPLVRGVISPRTALGVGLSTGIAGPTILYVGCDPVTAALGLSNIALYAGLYTYLKPRSEWNTWVGAVVGAIPPVMGWTASGGSLLDPEAVLLGGTLFLWQFPHFFALAWMHRVDYARGKFEMVPVNDAETAGDRTAKLISDYTIYMSAIPLVSTAAGVTNSMFLLEGLALNGYAYHVARRFDRERSNSNARKVFLTSLWYLPCLMTLFVLHSRNWRDEEEDTEEEKLGYGEQLRLSIQEIINSIRETGKQLCVHEVAAVKGLDGSAKEDMCPVTLGKTRAKAVAAEAAQVSSKATEVTTSVSPAEEGS